MNTQTEKEKIEKEIKEHNEGIEDINWYCSTYEDDKREIVQDTIKKMLEERDWRRRELLALEAKLEGIKIGEHNKEQEILDLRNDLKLMERLNKEGKR
jgi:predicted nucleotidyltransferase